MKLNKVELLFTSSVSQHVLERAKGDSIALDVIPFIDIELLKTDILQSAINFISRQKITAIFTSRNAVKSVANLLTDRPKLWDIICLSGATKQSVSFYLPECSIIASEENAFQLSKMISPDIEQPVYFFSGNLSLDTIPDKLRESNIPYTNLVVYHTHLNKLKIHKNYDAIAFCSPSAVDSFFDKNRVSAKTILFSIGSTTTKAIERKTRQTIITSKQSTQMGILNEIIAYYHDKK